MKKGNIAVLFMIGLIAGLLTAASVVHDPVPRERGIMADPGFQHESWVSSVVPATGGVDSVIAFNADLIPFIKNDGAVDILVAFDNNGKLATTLSGPGVFTIKAAESWTYIPVRTAHIAVHSTGAASAVRVAGLW